VTTNDDYPLLTLKSAILAVRAVAARDREFRIGLACGFTPLHMTSFIEAYASHRLTEARPTVVSGTYGDLAISLADLTAENVDGTVVLLEWPDLDPRLSVRRAGTALLAEIVDVIETARTRLQRIDTKIADVARTSTVVVVPPTLEFPPYFTARARQVVAGEAGVRAELAHFFHAISAHQGVRIASCDTATGSSVEASYDLRTHLRADFPYTLGHASAVARDSVTLLLSPPSKKGVITDLDDTLWRGLVGEVGPDGVTWDLDSGSQVHAMYQQLLCRLADSGVLIGVASKNEQTTVEVALARPDMVAPVGKLFPVIASWQPKSHMVADILTAWNIAESDVVMVDDSSLELAEITEMFPGITPLLFTPDQPAGVLTLIRRIDDLFSRDARTAEDALRVASLRSGADFARAKDNERDYESFLIDVGATITLEFDSAHRMQRAFELVNKTNQFNLNGRRPTLAEWQALAGRPGSVSTIGHYSDRFGDLGAISILAGQVVDATLVIDTWVLSCRAFARAVEHHMLAALVKRYGVRSVRFAYKPTDRNKPLQNFMSSLGVDLDAGHTAVSSDDIVGQPLAHIHLVSTLDAEPNLAPMTQGDIR
jgi:FkbH-like protein